jgi:hypothetical protein
MARSRLLLAACAAALWTLGPAVATAPAATPCWRTVLAQWSAGSLGSAHTPACYRTALDRMPADLAMYSSAQDDITQALLGAIARQPAGSGTQARAQPAVVGDLSAPKVVAAGGILVVATALLVARRWHRVRRD